MANLFNLSDVFISYAHEDRDFVKRLETRLKQDGREVWVDWEDIPGGVEWWEEIRAGIEGANNFAFIISPDSITSKVCRDEIEQALSANKRLIPVLYREPQDEQKGSLHPAVRSHNWLFIRPDDDFENAYTALIKTLDTDQDYTRQHTRLQVRAREWDTGGRERGLLLGHMETEQAETWLLSAGDKQPRPTDLHRDYIQASAAEQRRLAEIERQRQAHELELQRRSANRLRYLAIVLAAFFVVASGLLGWVLVTQNRLDETEVQQFFDTGNIYFERGEYGQAIAEYTRLLERRPEQVESYYRRGLAHYHQDKLDLAQADLKQAVDLDTHFAGAYYGLGLVAARQSDYQSAVQAYNRAIERDPTFSDAYFQRGETYAALGSANIGPSRTDLSPEATQFYQQAISDYADAIRLQPAFALAYTNRGQVYATLREFQRAVDDFNRAIEVDPALTEAYQARANAYVALGEADLAFADYHQSNENNLVSTLTPTLFERLPVDLADVGWTQYYGNTTFAFQYGFNLSYPRYAQWLHNGVDLGNITDRDVPVFAGIEGTLVRVDRRGWDPAAVYIKSGAYTVIYGNIIPLDVQGEITPNTIIGRIRANNGLSPHVHIEIRFEEQLNLNPLVFMPDNLIFPLLEKFPPSGFYFYRDSNWTRWQTPLDQPVITRNGPVVGPHTAVSGS